MQLACPSAFRLFSPPPPAGGDVALLDVGNGLAAFAMVATQSSMWRLMAGAAQSSTSLSVLSFHGGPTILVERVVFQCVRSITGQPSASQLSGTIRSRDRPRSSRS